ncbi:hypothetical protein SH528x_003192 [Novipirellula sp. SH528]|uniref:hypothetical protein n=1 Tax=Novipirellula sp. SH528 TaxID=3454466 RepID=UPI003FA1768C
MLQATAQAIWFDKTDDKPDFDIVTTIEVPSGEIGVYGWPWQLQDSYTINPGIARIRFRGFRTADTDDEKDYYVIEIEAAAPDAAPERRSHAF